MASHLCAIVPASGPPSHTYIPAHIRVDKIGSILFSFLTQAREKDYPIEPILGI